MTFPLRKRVIPSVLCAAMLLGTPGLADPVTFDIAAQPLSEALTVLATQADLQLLVSEKSTAGKRAPALQGTMEPEEALEKLLEGSGLKAVYEADGSVVIQAQKEPESVTLDKLTVTAPTDGSARAGYRVDNVQNAGLWGEKPVIDMPYSLNILSEDLIENSIVNNTDQLFKMSPTVQLAQPYDMNGLTRVMLRGFLVQSAMVDGTQGDVSGEGIYIDNVERVEVMTGLSGFMYGIGHVGGTINYVTKRPTLERFTNLTVGNYGGGQYFGQADLGGKIDEEGKYAYRLNVSGQNGDTALKDQSVKRWMISGAFDWRPVEGLLVNVNAMHGYYKLDGRPAQWLFSSGLSDLPPAPDNDYTWSSPDTFNQNETDRAEAGLAYKINDIFSVRARYAYQDETRRYLIAANLVTSDQNYTMRNVFAGIYETKTNAGYAYVDARFDVLGVGNTVTFGFNGYTSESYTGTATPSAQGVVGTGLSLNDPSSADIDLANVVYDDSMTKTDKDTVENYLIGDDIRFGGQWTALVGVNYAKYTSKSYTSTSYYSKGKATPSFSLLYKPLSSLTAYATYIEALEEGRTVSDTSSSTYTNNGEVFDPMTSKQYEVGVKAELDRTLLTLALYQIRKATTYDEDNGDGTKTAYQNGEQVHQGVEVTVSGRPLDDLALFGGYSYVDAEVKKSTDKTIEGNVPRGVAKQMAKMYAEYDLPRVHGVTVTGGVYYTGPAYVDAANTLEAPAYTVGDLGLRYATAVYGYDTTLRLDVTNVTDERYWMSNYTTGAMLGAPRTIAFSGTMKF